MKYLLSFSIIFLIFCVSCGNQSNQHTDRQSSDALFLLRDTSETGIAFINEIRNSEKYNILTYRNFYNGGGVAIGDINNDGLDDVYLTSNMGGNKLYLNEGHLSFKDITQSAQVESENHWSTGVTMVDINDDNLMDIYVSNAGYREKGVQGNHLYINQGDNTFTEESTEYGLNDSSYTTQACFFDYDRDGDLDVYLLNNSFIPVNTLNYSNERERKAKDWPVRDFLKGGGDKLLENRDGQFVDVSAEAGIYQSLIGFGLGVTAGDFNEDGWMDLYVCNDFFERDYLYINDQNGHFTEELESWMGHLSLASMGADVADVNGDQRPDLFVTEMLPDDEYRLKTNTAFENINLFNLKQSRGFFNQYMCNTLQVNDGAEGFNEVGHYAGVAASDWSWGALMMDGDNDGRTDLFICNGIYQDVINQDFIDFFADELMQKMVTSGKKEKVDSILSKMPSNPIPNAVFRNMGNLKFKDVREEWGFGKKTFSNGAAYGDLDRDGDLDLIINNVNMPSMLYENRSNLRSDHHYINIKLSSDGGHGHTLGAGLYLYADSLKLYRINIPSRGFQSSSSDLLHFGLGEMERIDSLKIVWPDGRGQMVYDLPVDTLLLIEKDINLEKKADGKVTSLFTEVGDHPFQRHKENDYLDFNYERGILEQLSDEGPCGLYTDINGDGLKDILLGGAAGQEPQLYSGRTDGRFVLEDLGQAGQFYKPYEDVALNAEDYDQDGDIDIIFGTGGNAYPPGSRAMKDRFTIHEDQGFSYDAYSLSSAGMNTSVILDYDFDEDGDVDLFVGASSVPRNYGYDAPQALYENVSGRFVDVTEEKHPQLLRAGKIRDAVFADVYGGPHKELILVRDWDAPAIFTYNGVSYEEIETNLGSLKSWWRSVSVADLNNDGQNDLILGNLGSNFYLNESNFPIKLWINDYDGNESMEKFLTRTVEERDMPVFNKREFFDQVNSLKKNNLLHEDFARKSIQDLLDDELLEKSLTFEVNYNKTIIAYNTGQGQFRITALPIEAQLSSVHDIHIEDLNDDDRLDMILAGNDDGFLPQFGRLDAMNGLVLLQGEDGQFRALNSAESGLRIEGETRQILPIEYKGKDAILFLINNEKPKLYIKNDED